MGKVFGELDAQEAPRRTCCVGGVALEGSSLGGREAASIP